MAATRSYSARTIKILFGQCGNQCAEPDCTNPIIAPGTEVSDDAVVGQICHIYAASDNGPRGKPGMSEEERNSPPNLILLCGVHHPLVDKQYETYPASHLIEWKKIHEARFNAGTAEAVRREADLQKHAFLERLSDQEIEQAVNRLRRARFLGGFDGRQEALMLASKVETSELSGGSREERAGALAWCARLLIHNDTLGRARELVAKSKELVTTPEAALAEIFITAATDKMTALRLLAGQHTPASRSAGLRIVINADGPAEALAWAERAGLDEGSFDTDGKFAYAFAALATENWDLLFRIARNITEEDTTENAAIMHLLAMTKLLSTVPVEMRRLVASQVPVEAAEFRLASEPADIEARRDACQLFGRLAEFATSLGLMEAANVASDYALWLELRDPRDHQKGLERLRDSMRDPVQSLRRLNLALKFGLKLDIPAIEKRLDRSVALSGLGTGDEAFARYALVFAQENPKEAALYIARHRSELYAHLQKLGVMGTEIELLARSGSINAANELLTEAVAEGLGERDQETLRRIISECSGADPVAERRATYETTGEIRALVSLADALEARSLWEDLLPYAEKLFAATHALEDCFRLARCLNALGRYGELYRLLSTNTALVEQSANLRSLWAWTLYREGSFKKAEAVLEAMPEHKDSPSHRALTVNIAIASGSWATLLVYCEQIWATRDTATVEELLQAAGISQALGGPHSRDLVLKAVEKEPENPAVLIAAYAQAVRGSWEQNPQVSGWLQTAAGKSGSGGPVQSVSLKEVVEQKPAWDKQARDIFAQLSSGRMPAFAAAEALHRSLLNMTLLPSLANRLEGDVRKRPTVYAFSGARQSVAIPMHAKIAIDPSAMVTLAVLGLLDQTIASFRLVIPHSMLGWLFQEREKVAFHQPSRVKDARLLKQLLANGTLTVLAPAADQDPDLSRELGSDLANMLLAAKSATAAGTPTVVVRAPPIHRLGSFMDELADVSSFRQFLCSCTTLVNVLKMRGVLTAVEESHARAFLRLQERMWEDEQAVDDTTHFLLDGIALSQLRAAGLLAKLRQARLRVSISADEDQEANALIEMDGLSDEQLSVIEVIRRTLADGLRSGRVLAARATHVEEERALQAHPSMAVLNVSQPVAAILCDDRYINQHPNIVVNEQVTPIVTTLDLLAHLAREGVLSASEEFAHRTTLRQSGYQLIAVTEAELQAHLAAATVVGGVLVQSAELKAIRQSLLQARMRRMVQLPQEAPFLQTTQLSLLHCIQWAWQNAASEEEAIAHSEWLMGRADMRGWAASAMKGAERNFAVYGYAQYVLQLISALTTADDNLRKRYLRWISERLIEPFKDMQPEAFEWIVARSKELIAAGVDNASAGMTA